MGNSTLNSTESHAAAKSGARDGDGMTAPDRIWAKGDEYYGAVQLGRWADTIRQLPDGVEYIRSDLHEAALDLLRDRDGGSHDADCKINRGPHPFCNCGHMAVEVFLTGYKGAAG